MINSFLKQKFNSLSDSGAGADFFPELSSEAAVAQLALSRKVFDASHKYTFPRSTVTIAMTVKFPGKSPGVAGHYAKDLAKIGSLLTENAGLIATLDSCQVANASAVPVEISMLRLKNVMNYLIDNFSIQRSRFYVDKLMNSLSYNEGSENKLQGYGGVSILLKYPMRFS